MRTFRALTVTVTATILLAAAPASHAQSPEELKMMQTFLSIMQDYFQIIEATHDVASDSEKAAIMQMQKIKEVYEERGDKAESIGMLRRVLEDSRNQAIRNAAYIMLGDTLKETGQAKAAIEILEQGLAENIRQAQ